MTSKNNNPLKMDVIQGIADRPKSEGKMLPSQAKRDVQHGSTLPAIFTQNQPYGQGYQSSYPPQGYPPMQMHGNFSHAYPPSGFSSFSTFPSPPVPTSDPSPTSATISKSGSASVTLPQTSSKKQQPVTNSSTNDAILDLLTKIVTRLKTIDDRTKDMDARQKTVEQNTAGITKIQEDLANILDILNNKDNDEPDVQPQNTDVERIKKLGELLDEPSEQSEDDGKSD